MVSKGQYLTNSRFFTLSHGCHVGVHNNREKNSFRNFILLVCKIWATFCHSSVHQLNEPKLAISQSEANSTVLISYDIKSLTWYPSISRSLSSKVMLPYDKLQRGFANKQTTRNLRFSCCFAVKKGANISRENLTGRRLPTASTNTDSDLTMESELKTFSLNLDFWNFENETPNKRV